MNTNLTFASFHFSLFVATFLVFPVVLIVLPRCVSPLCFPVLGSKSSGMAESFSANARARLRRQELLASIRKFFFQFFLVSKIEF